MDLLCTEGQRLQRAYPDPVFLKDDRVVANLLKLEEHYTIPCNYMDRQTDTKAYMRKIVAQWMLEVCEEQQCEEEVFGLAVNFLDRFLAATSDVKRNRLQLLATVCMFIASKLKETYPLSAEKLVIYTDYSITLRELLDWEMLVLAKLRWDVSAITPLDFLDVLLDRLRLPSEVLRATRKHAIAYISLCALDEKCVVYPPSMLTSACVCTALETITSTWRAALYSNVLQEIIGVDKDVLRSCQEHVYRVTGSRPQSPVKGEKPFQSGTPTEVMDVTVI